MAIPIQEATINLLGFFTVEHTFMMSAALAVGWVLLYFVVWGLHLWWAWFDDTETTDNNWLIIKNCKMWGYSLNNPERSHLYSKKDWANSEGDGPWLWTLLVLGIAPFLFLFASLNPLVIITLSTIVALAFVARGIRRYKKLFDKHAKDKNAHD